MSQFNYVTITPSDGTPQTGLITAIYIGGAGNVAVKGPGDSAAVTIVAPVAGKWLWLPHPVLCVMATNTTASSLVGALATSTRPIADLT